MIICPMFWHCPTKCQCPFKTTFTTPSARVYAIHFPEPRARCHSSFPPERFSIGPMTQHFFSFRLVASLSESSQTLPIRRKCGSPAWKILMGRYSVSRNLHYWPTPPRATSRISIVQWFGISSSWVMWSIPWLDILKATEPSRELYSTFLKRLGQSYKPEKIQGRTHTIGYSISPHWIWF